MISDPHSAVGANSVIRPPAGAKSVREKVAVETSFRRRKIAEAVELDKNTVNKYINQAKKDSLSVDELLALDDPVLAHRMTGGNAAYSDSRFDELKDKLPYYASELRRPHVTMQLLSTARRPPIPTGSPSSRST